MRTVQSISSLPLDFQKKSALSWPWLPVQARFLKQPDCLFFVLLLTPRRNRNDSTSHWSGQSAASLLFLRRFSYFLLKLLTTECWLLTTYSVLTALVTQSLISAPPCAGRQDPAPSAPDLCRGTSASQPPARNWD